MAPKGQIFETSLREPKKVSPNVPDRRKKVSPRKQERIETEKEEETLMTKYIAVSPRIFRKNIFHTNRLQKEIIVGKQGSFKAIEFDPALQRKAPIYLDIPNLYTRKRYHLDLSSQEVEERKRYKYVPEQEVLEDDNPRYVYIPRPVTPKNYNPRPKSSNRYVFVGVKPRYKELSVELKSNNVKCFNLYSVLMVTL